MSGIVKHLDMWVPAGSEQKARRYFRSASDVQIAVRECKQRKVVVQAGGNIGAWPQYLSHLFETVYTFEPEPTNYECLLLNCKSVNVRPMRAALSDKPDKLSLRFSAVNIGGHSMKREEGDVQAVTIDQLNLPACDLIVLDVEGWEYQALAGGLATIDRYSPIIMLEERGHGVKKGEGHTLQDIFDLLPDYRAVHSVGHDIVMRRGA